MKPLVLHVLLALSEQPQHGYSLMKLLQSEGQVSVHTGSLYRALRTLLDEGLVEELGEAPDGVNDDARRGSYYRVSAEGREAIAIELHRLRTLVSRGRRLGFAAE